MQRVVTRRAGDGRERAKVGSSPFRQFIDGREMFPCKSEIARPRPARNSCGEAVATLCSTPRACFRRAANSIEVGRRGARRKSCIQKRSELNHITGSTHDSWLAPRERYFAQADQTTIAYPFLNGTPNARIGDRLRLACPYSVNVARQRPVTAPIRSFLHSRRPGDVSARTGRIGFSISISKSFRDCSRRSSEWSKTCNPAIALGQRPGGIASVRYRPAEGRAR